MTNNTFIYFKQGVAILDWAQPRKNCHYILSQFSQWFRDPEPLLYELARVLGFGIKSKMDAKSKIQIALKSL